MRCTAVTLLSAATFSLCAFARPPPPQPAIGSAALEKRYASGWCGVHVVQYQKDEGPTNGGNYDYRLDVTLYDALQDNVGFVPRMDAAGGNFIAIVSLLTDVFEVEVGGNDQQPVRFQYNGQVWSSNDGQCSVGGYDSGSRNMDCGFTC